MARNIKRENGGGPWGIDPCDHANAEGTAEAIQPGDSVSIPLDRIEYRGRKRYFVPWLPMDVIQVKNLTTNIPVAVELNGQFDVLVEPNAVDTFDRVGVRTVELTNDSTTEQIDPGDVIIQVSVEPYGADQAALSQAQRGPVEKVVRGVFNQ